MRTFIWGPIHLNEEMQLYELVTILGLVDGALIPDSLTEQHVYILRLLYNFSTPCFVSRWACCESGIRNRHRLSPRITFLHFPRLYKNFHNLNFPRSNAMAEPKITTGGKGKSSNLHRRYDLIYTKLCVVAK